jgi:TonB family protein
MRRHIVHISLALFTFTIGFLATGTYDGLIVALLVAFIVFILLQKIASLKITLHHLKVAALTLLIWMPFAAFVLQVAMPPTSCVIDLPEAEINRVEETDRQGQPPATKELNGDVSFNASHYPRGTNGLTSNIIWAGVVDKKALIKPAPRYPPEARAAHIESTVAVAVIVDAAGRVIAAQPLSGHPLLRQPAVEAAYWARFSPTKVDGAPLYVSGVLTYRFNLR